MLDYEDIDDLIKAVLNDDYDTVRSILAEDYDQQYIDKAFYTACSKGNLDIAMFLHKNNANIYTFGGDTLLIACIEGHYNIVKYLLRHGMDADIQNNEPIYLASENGHADVVELLLEHGADIHKEQDIALVVATAEGRIDVVRLLLKIAKNPQAHTDCIDYARGVRIRQWKDTFPEILELLFFVPNLTTFFGCIENEKFFDFDSIVYETSP